MSDYADGLRIQREAYIDSRINQDTGISLKGLGAPNAPTPERQFDKAKKEGKGPAANALAESVSIVQENQPDVATDTPFDYELQWGDTLSELSEKYKIPVAQILRLNKGNPAIETADLIYAGGTIKLAQPQLSKEFTPKAQPFETSNMDIILKGLADKYSPTDSKFKIPYEFIKAVGTQESGLEYAEGALDEKGIMQVRPIALEDINSYYDEFQGNPITMKQLTEGSGKYNIDRSIEAGVAYLAMLRDRYGAKNLKEVATMYNGGPNAVRSGNKKANAYSNSVLAIMKTVKPFEFSSEDKSIGTVKTEELLSAPSVSQTNEVLSDDTRGNGLKEQINNTRNFKLSTEKLKRGLLENDAIEDTNAQREQLKGIIENVYKELFEDNPLYKRIREIDESFGTEYGKKLRDRILKKEGLD